MKDTLSAYRAGPLEEGRKTCDNHYFDRYLFGANQLEDIKTIGDGSQKFNLQPTLLFAETMIDNVFVVK